MTQELALFPLNTVLFPGGRLPLRIFEQRYMDMAKRCLRDGSPFGVCAIREGQEVGAPAVPADVGCTARIGEWDMAQLGLLEVIAHGEQRFRIVERRVERNGLQVARIEILPAENDAPVPESCAACVRLLERVIEQHAGLLPAPHRLDSATWLSSRLAELLPLPLAEKQALLEVNDAAMRLERVNALLRTSARAEP
ncbi:MAG TPA: LON peptidase substrate-binding domain-containing protein [Burkholderiales bacterium]|nr:LON peptidase substrate-binding domain-containing protein [Burkholderiales bacterium]